MTRRDRAKPRPGHPADDGGERDPDRSHAGRGGEARLGAFHEAKPLLEHRDRRVAVAAVDVVVDLVLEGRLGLLRGLVDIARGQEERLTGLVKTATGQSSSHREGLWCVGCVVTRRGHQPCLHGNPTFFQPDTLR